MICVYWGPPRDTIIQSQVTWGHLRHTTKVSAVVIAHSVHHPETCERGR